MRPPRQPPGLGALCPDDRTTCRTGRNAGMNSHKAHRLVLMIATVDCPIYHHYELMLASKTKPDLAKLTIARQIAAITLSLWKKEVAYDPAKLIKNS